MPKWLSEDVAGNAIPEVDEGGCCMVLLRGVPGKDVPRRSDKSGSNCCTGDVALEELLWDT